MAANGCDERVDYGKCLTRIFLFWFSFNNSVFLVHNRRSVSTEAEHGIYGDDDGERTLGVPTVVEWAEDSPKNVRSRSSSMKVLARGFREYFSLCFRRYFLCRVRCTKSFTIPLTPSLAYACVCGKPRSSRSVRNCVVRKSILVGPLFRAPPRCDARATTPSRSSSWYCIILLYRFCNYLRGFQCEFLVCFDTRQCLPTLYSIVCFYVSCSRDFTRVGKQFSHLPNDNFTFNWS